MKRQQKSKYRGSETNLATGSTLGGDFGDSSSGGGVCVCVCVYGGGGWSFHLLKARR